MRSSAGPKPSRIRGLCTRPSVPMMKLTVTALVEPGASSNGFGVAKASGGCAASQLARAAARAMVEKLELRTATTPSLRSRSAKVRAEGTGIAGTSTDATQTAESASSANNETKERRGMNFMLFRVMNRKRGCRNLENNAFCGNWPSSLRLQQKPYKHWLSNQARKEVRAKQSENACS